MTEDDVRIYKHSMAEAFAHSAHYVAELDSLLRDRLKKTFDRMEEAIAIAKDESIATDWEDQIEFDSVTSPMFYLNWSFAHAYATFELHLQKLCELHYSEQKLTLDDIKGRNAPHTMQKYLVCVCNLDLTELDSDFSKISDYRLIRNKIVHSLSDLWDEKEKPLESQNLYKRIKVFDGIAVSHRPEGHFYIYKPIFITEFTTIAESLIRRILDKMKVKG